MPAAMIFGDMNVDLLDHVASNVAGVFYWQPLSRSFIIHKILRAGAAAKSPHVASWAKFAAVTISRVRSLT